MSQYQPIRARVFRIRISANPPIPHPFPVPAFWPVKSPFLIFYVTFTSSIENLFPHLTLIGSLQIVNIAYSQLAPVVCADQKWRQIWMHRILKSFAIVCAPLRTTDQDEYHSFHTVSFFLFNTSFSCLSRHFAFFPVLFFICMFDCITCS